MAHILVIDDDSAVRTIVRLALEAAGHDVEEAADGREGILACESGTVDLVLCDLLMPNKEGMETIRDLLVLWPGLKIIAISGNMTRFDGRKLLPVARIIGATSALPKPFGVKTLRWAVDEALRGT